MIDKIKSKISHWHKVDKNAYELILRLAQERLDDVLAESESVTNKSITIVTALVTITGFFSGYVLTNPLIINNHISLIAWCGAGLLLDVILLVSLILPKSVKSRGLAPIVSLVDDFDNDGDKNHQVELVYYNSVSVIQENIDYMIDKNSDRAKLYKLALIGFLIIIALISWTIVFIISHP